MRILLVDDDEFVRATLSCILKRIATVDAAENGMEAVSKFVEARHEGDPYNIIIMDYQMPVMDGCEALFIIRMLELEQDPDTVTPVYISSGDTYCLEHFSSRITLDPNIHFVGKPFNLSSFVNDIRALCV